jgi:hypothetical protein
MQRIGQLVAAGRTDQQFPHGRSDGVELVDHIAPRINQKSGRSDVAADYFAHAAE